MSLYRSFLLGWDNEILGFHLLECLNDSEALSASTAVRAECKSIEVWQAARLVGTVEPQAANQLITKPKQNAAIETDILIAGLEAVGAAFAIYDAADRLLVFSNRYATLRSAIGGNVVVGVSWIDLITSSLEAGTIPEALGREKHWLEERRRARGAYTVVRQTPDARSYQITERRMLNGAVAVMWTEVGDRATAGHLVPSVPAVPIWKQLYASALRLIRHSDSQPQRLLELQKPGVNKLPI